MIRSYRMHATTKDPVHLAPIDWKLLIRRRPSATQGIPPGKEDLNWVANTCTLIYSENQAILVDTFLTAAHANELADWIAASGKQLTAICITHAHPDHFFGLKLLRARFPQARAFAPREVVEGMTFALSPEAISSWRRRFPGLIPAELATAETLESGSLQLEGNEIAIVDVGHTDTDHTCCVRVPLTGLLIAGDAVYNETHPYMVESDRQGLIEWLAALDKIDALEPRTVVCGHGPFDPDNSPRHIRATRRYIQDFICVDEETRTAEQLYERMLTLYPNRINPGSLWASAHAAKGRLSRQP